MDRFFIAILAVIITLLLVMGSGVPIESDTIKATASYIDTQCPNSKVMIVWMGGGNIDINCDDGTTTSTPVDVILDVWYNK